MSDLSPVVAEVVVPSVEMEAFVAFTANMAEWWDPLLTPEAATFSGVEIDPAGDIKFHHGEDTFTWGRTTTWQPGEQFTFDLWLAHDQAPPTTVDVRFAAAAEGDSAGTRVTLTHGGWTEESVAVRDKFLHWDVLLERYAAHASR